MLHRYEGRPSIPRASTCGENRAYIELAAEMMRADTGFHADQARWHVGKAGLDLATRPLLPQHDGTTLVVAYNVERVLADIDADHGDYALELLGHGVLLLWRPFP